MLPSQESGTFYSRRTSNPNHMTHTDGDAPQYAWISDRSPASKSWPTRQSALPNPQCWKDDHMIVAGDPLQVLEKGPVHLRSIPNCSPHSQTSAHYLLPSCVSLSDSVSADRQPRVARRGAPCRAARLVSGPLPPLSRWQRYCFLYICLFACHYLVHSVELNGA